MGHGDCKYICSVQNAGPANVIVSDGYPDLGVVDATKSWCAWAMLPGSEKVGQGVVIKHGTFFDKDWTFRRGASMD